MLGCRQCCGVHGFSRGKHQGDTSQPRQWLALALISFDLLSILFFLRLVRLYKANLCFIRNPILIILAIVRNPRPP